MWEYKVLLSRSGGINNWLPSETEWLSQKTWDLIAERKQMKRQLRNAHVPNVQINKQSDYRKIEIKKIKRADKKNYSEQKVMQAEDVAKKWVSMNLYKLTNEIIGKQPIQDGSVRNSDGFLIAKRSAIDGT